jgi:hypothetical protein
LAWWQDIYVGGEWMDGRKREDEEEGGGVKSGSYYFKSNVLVASLFL